MASLCFDFTTVRTRQRRCSLPVLRSAVCPDELKELESLVKDGHVKKVHPVLNAKISSNDASSEVKFMALLLRADMQVKRTKDAEAKADLESAIFENPNVVEAYLRLFEVETKLGHFAKAEVVASLGLRLDPDNSDLKAKLNALRQPDNVHPSLAHRNGSRLHLMQIKAGLEFHMLPLPEIIKAIMSANLARLRELWRPEYVSLRHSIIKSPLIHVAVHSVARAQEVRRDGSRRPPAASLVNKFKKVVDFLFERGCRLDARDYAGFTAVSHAACDPPQLDILEHLLKKGADPNLQSSFGCYPLLNTIEFQNVKAAEILLRYGANPFLRHNEGRTASNAAHGQPRMAGLIQRFARS